MTLVVEDLPAWRARVGEAGARGITVIEQRDDLGIQRFFCCDPVAMSLSSSGFSAQAIAARFTQDL